MAEKPVAEVAGPSSSLGGNQFEQATFQALVEEKSPKR